MDERTRAEVIKALRSAVRALRAVEKAIVQGPSSSPATSAPAPTTEPATPATAPAESELLSFIKTSALSFKQQQEQNPEAFLAKLQPKQADLLRFAVAKQMFQEGPKGAGATSLDPTPATQLFEKLLKAMTETGLNQTDLLQPFVLSLVPKNWGDVNVDEDLVLYRYETPGALTVDLDKAQLEALVEAARAVPGALERVASNLKGEHVCWEPTDQKTGSVNLSVTLDNVEAKWCGCVPTSQVLAAVLSQLSVVEVDEGCQQPGWWDTARTTPSLPQQVLPIVRGNEKKVVFLRVDADKIEDWASALPGWYDGPEEAPTPLIVRDAVSSDILTGEVAA